MKSSYISLSFGVLLLGVVTACDNNQGSANAASSGDLIETPKDGKSDEDGMFVRNDQYKFNPDKPYTYEEGVIEYKFTGSFEGTHAEYFTEYGKQRRIVNKYTNKATPSAQKVDEVYIYSPNKVIFYDLTTKKGYERNLPDSVSEGSNLNLDLIRLGVDSAMRKNGYRPGGIEKIDGNTCEVYVSEDGESKFCFHKGINIKTVMRYGDNVNYTLEATKIDFKRPKIKEDLFKVPEDVKILSYDVWVKNNTSDKL